MLRTKGGGGHKGDDGVDMCATLQKMDTNATRFPLFRTNIAAMTTFSLKYE